MKKFINLFSLFLVVIFTSCSKEDNNTNSLIGSYTLIKIGDEDLKTGEFTHDYESVSGELTFLSDNTYRITMTVNGKGSADIGIYDSESMKLDNRYDIILKDGYLIVVFAYEDTLNYVAYFKKK